MVLHLVVLALGATLASSAAPEEAVIVFRAGKPLVVRGYSVDGAVMHLTSLRGELQVLRLDLVDVPATDRASAAHRAALRRSAEDQDRIVRASDERRERVRRVNDIHRAHSSGRRGMNIGSGNGALVLEDAPDEGRAQARDRLRSELARSDRVLLFFQSERCPDCRRVENEVLTQPAVARALDGYEVRSLDLREDSELAHRYGIRRVPAFVVLGPGDKVLRSTRGFQPADAFAAWLAR